jgi:hypothetical protein
MSKGKELKYQTTEIEGKKYYTLEKWLSPLIDRFSFKPDKNFARYLFGNFNDQKIWYYAINGEMCFTFREFAKYLDMKKSSVRRSFYRKDLIEGKHYFKATSDEFKVCDILSQTSKFVGKSTEFIFLTFLGVWKLLPSFRGDIPNQLYEWFGERLYEHLKKYKLSKGQFFLSNKSSGKIVEQVLGDPSRNYVDCRGFRYASKGELLIANILNGLKVHFQYNTPIYLPKELKVKIKQEYNCKYSYLTADFMIRTIPKTIIEYWGIEGDSYYNWKRKVKEFCYNWLEIKLISIEHNEDQNAPQLKKKLRKLLKLKKSNEVIQ